MESRNDLISKTLLDDNRIDLQKQVMKFENTTSNKGPYLEVLVINSMMQDDWKNQ